MLNVRPVIAGQVAARVSRDGSTGLERAGRYPGGRNGPRALIP
jgi:hypothetical protein